MTAVFADTAYYFALLSREDEFHAAAVRLTSKLARPIVTSGWVLTELADGLCRVQHRVVAAAFIHDLRNDPRVTVVAPPLEWLDRGLALYGRRSDKNWSLTDCLSFEIMRELGLDEALTADRHFDQAGFKALLLA